MEPAALGRAGSNPVICCMDLFDLDDSSGALCVSARPFKVIVPSFKSPFLSTDIGNYLCKRGLEKEAISFNFSKIVAKCFAFALKMPRCQTIDPANRKQTWICQFIRHSDLM